MFNFLKAAGPAPLIAEVLWQRALESAKVAAQDIESNKYIEACYFFGFTIDAIILGVYRKRPNELTKLRNHFYANATNFAERHQLSLPPLGQYPSADDNRWEIKSYQPESDDYPRMVVERFNLYATAFGRPWAEGKFMPASLMLAALVCDYDIAFLMAATELHISMSQHTQTLLNKIRITN